MSVEDSAYDDLDDQYQAEMESRILAEAEAKSLRTENQRLTLVLADQAREIDRLRSRIRGLRREKRKS